MAMQSRSRVMSNINITPLVDVMLVLLIIFMVAAPVMEKERSKKELDENRDKQQRLVALNLPAINNSPSETQIPQTLVMSVSNDLVVTFNNKPIADCSDKTDAIDKKQWQPCFDKIENAVRENADANFDGVIVDAQPNAKFGFIVGIMHRLHNAGVEKVSMFPKTSI